MCIIFRIEIVTYFKNYFAKQKQFNVISDLLFKVPGFAGRCGASFMSGPDVGGRKVQLNKVIPIKPFASILHNQLFLDFCQIRWGTKCCPLPGSYAPDYMVNIAHF